MMFIMKTHFVNKKVISKIWFMLITVFLTVAPFSLKAQPEEYKTDQGVLLGTSDSRMFVTVVEDEAHVELQLSLVGPIEARAFMFPLLYNPATLKLTDNTFLNDVQDSEFPSKIVYPAIYAAPEFASQFPLYSLYANFHQPIAEGEALGMKMLSTNVSDVSGNPVSVILSAGEMMHIFSIYFRKVNHGTPLTTSDFGYYVQTAAVPMLPMETQAWLFGPFHVRFAPGQSWENFKLKPQLFTYRTPSSVTTETPTNLFATTATLNGAFSRGIFQPSNDIVVTEFKNLYAKSTHRLNWDDVNKCGFIFSKTDAAIFVNGFSKKLNIDGTDYDFPDAAELASGTFIRNGKTFNIKQSSNSSSNQTVSFSQNVTDLTHSSTYFAWSFIQYAFETSGDYLNVGEKITFQTLNESIACPSSLVYEGGPYTVTSLAGLCWTSNMANRHYANGDPIPFARAYYCPACQDSTTLASTFGLLYDWYSAVGSTQAQPVPSAPIQGICPTGWHIPTKEELALLQQYQVRDLKSEYYWIVPGGTNSTGFNALPAGRYNSATGSFEDMYGFTGYWASDADSGLTAPFYYINYYCVDFESNETLKTEGLSVRCVMD